MNKIVILCIFTFTLFFMRAEAQNAKINWINFEQLEDSLAVKPKKVLIFFYTDWCTYCKKMDKVAFNNPEVIAVLNSKYYAVKMNAELKDTITFGGEKHSNQQIGKRRKPTHQIALLLASRKNMAFTLPVNIILDKKFRITERKFEYLSSKKLLKLLK